MTLFQKIKQIATDPKQLSVLIPGVALLGMYVFYARKQLFPESKPKIKNSLQLSLQQLVKTKDPGNIIKIVFTQSSPNSIQFKKKLLTRLKQQLTNKGFNALVNCAPLKLFDAGSKVFKDTLDENDPDDQVQFMSYFQNALKCQLVVERTIIDIDQIKNKNTGKNTYLLCDSNSLDIKVNADQKMFNKFLQNQKIQIKDLQDNYNIVFHIQGSDQGLPQDIAKNYKQFMKGGDKKKDEKIQQAWKNFKYYYVIEEKPFLMFQENVQIALQRIFQKLRNFVPGNVTYSRRRVFAKEW